MVRIAAVGPLPPVRSGLPRLAPGFHSPPGFYPLGIVVLGPAKPGEPASLRTRFSFAPRPRHFLSHPRTAHRPGVAIRREARCSATLEHQTLKGGISRSAPCRLASTLQSLPPILHIKAQCSVSSYSKGSRGLSVLPRVHCIFTASSISLSLGWRQPGHHYAIRAGRNLPDKEFIYSVTTLSIIRIVKNSLIFGSFLNMFFYI